MHKDLEVIAQLEKLTGKTLAEVKLEDLWKNDSYVIQENGCITGLNLYEANISDLAPLASLTSLTGLYLNKNQIKDLSPLAFLTALTHLALNDNLISDLTPLASLTVLTGLYLSGNQINDLAPLSSLTTLTGLYLSGNQINDLAPLASLIALTGLHLSGNQIRDLAPLKSMNRLVILVLTSNPLQLLPLTADQAKRIQIFNYDEESLAKEIPASIINQGLSAICSYSRERADAPQRWVSKLVVVGCGGTGKTSLLRRLTNETFRADEDTTHGIRLGQLQLTHPRYNLNMTLYTWDFGGQDIYHATHQFFLTEGALVLVTWNARLGPEQGKVDYWLENIRARAPQAPILLVATHVDQRLPDIALQELQRRVPKLLGQVAFSSMKDIGLNELKQVLAHHAAGLPLMGERWPKSWLKAANHLCANPKKARPYLSQREVHRALRRGGLAHSDVHPLLARWLHQLGEILWFLDDPELGEIAILDPQWVTQSISLVLESEEVNQKGGLLTRDHLRQLWSDMDPMIHSHLLAMMERFDLSYKIEHQQDVSLVVERLPYEPPDYEDIWAAKAGEPEICLYLKLETSLPPGIPTWFIARTHRFSMNLHWRHGALFQDRESMGFIHAQPERRTVTLRVRGSKPWPFFSRLRDTLEETLDRYPGLEMARLIPCICGHASGKTCSHFFNLDRVEDAESKGLEALQCQNSFVMVSVDALLYGLTTRNARRGYELNDESHAHKLEKLIYGQDELIRLSHAGKERDQELTAMLQRHFLRQYRTEQSRVDSRVPALFSLVPVESNWHPEKLMGLKMRLQLYCEHPGYWHSTGESGCYNFDLDPVWLATAKPMLKEICKVLKILVPVIAPAASLAMNDYDVIAADLKLMEGFAKSLDVFDQHELNREPARQFQRAEGPELRWLRQLLERLDKHQTWGHLTATPTPEGEILWLCEQHRKLYR